VIFIIYKVLGLYAYVYWYKSYKIYVIHLLSYYICRGTEVGFTYDTCHSINC